MGSHGHGALHHLLAGAVTKTVEFASGADNPY